ncbi:MAG: hypothetical protein ACLGIF_07840, partial [Actinomycetes bacterium]
KGKTAGRPVAVLRGLDPDWVGDDSGRAGHLVRPATDDLFAYGRREAVVAAVLTALGMPSRYEELVALEADELVAAVTAGQASPEADLLARLLRAAAGPPLPDRGSGGGPG